MDARTVAEYWRRVSRRFRQAASKASDSVYLVECELSPGLPEDLFAPFSSVRDHVIRSVIDAIPGTLGLRSYWQRPVFRDGQERIIWIIVASSGDDDQWHAICEAAESAVIRYRESTEESDESIPKDDPVLMWLVTLLARANADPTGTGLRVIGGDLAILPSHSAVLDADDESLASQRCRFVRLVQSVAEASAIVAGKHHDAWIEDAEEKAVKAEAAAEEEEEEAKKQSPDLEIRLDIGEEAVLRWLADPSRVNRKWMRTAVVPDPPAPQDRKGIGLILDRLHECGLIHCPPWQQASIRSAGIEWIAANPPA